MSKGVHIREFLKFKPIDMFNNYRTDNKIIFEDGVIVYVKHKDMILTRYVIEVLEAYPELPIISDYLITNYYSNKTFTNKTVNSCFEAILKDVVLKICQVKDDYSNLDRLYYNMYKVTEAIYNDIGYGAIEYSSSSNIIDYIDIQMDPRLLTAIDEVDEHKDVESIKTGDLYLSSGLGLLFPPDFPVAVVQEKHYNPADSMTTISATTVTDFNRTRELLLIWQAKRTLEKQEH